MCYFLEVPPWVQIFSQYEGLCMVGLTFIYLVTSIFFVLSAYRSTQTAENVLKEMRRQRKEENRPYVHFDIQMDPNRMALFVLNNSGRTLAKKLQVRFHQTLWIYKNFKEMEEEQREKP
jgi:hypothetical protein